MTEELRNKINIKDFEINQAVKLRDKVEIFLNPSEMTTEEFLSDLRKIYEETKDG